MTKPKRTQAPKTAETSALENSVDATLYGNEGFNNFKAEFDKTLQESRKSGTTPSSEQIEGWLTKLEGFATNLGELASSDTLDPAKPSKDPQQPKQNFNFANNEQAEKHNGCRTGIISGLQETAELSAKVRKMEGSDEDKLKAAEALVSAFRDQSEAMSGLCTNIGALDLKPVYDSANLQLGSAKKAMEPALAFTAEHSLSIEEIEAQSQEEQNSYKGIGIAAPLKAMGIRGTNSPLLKEASEHDRNEPDPEKRVGPQILKFLQENSQDARSATLEHNLAESGLGDDSQAAPSAQEVFDEIKGMKLEEFFKHKEVTERQNENVSQNEKETGFFASIAKFVSTVIDAFASALGFGEKDAAPSRADRVEMMRRDSTASTASSVDLEPEQEQGKGNMAAALAEVRSQGISKSLQGVSGGGKDGPTDAISAEAQAAQKEGQAR